MAAFLLLYVWTGLRWLVRHSGLLKLLPPRPAPARGAATPVTPHNLFAPPAGSRPGGGAEATTRWRWSPDACSASSNPGVNEATLRVLAAEGCEVVVPRWPGLLRRALHALPAASMNRWSSPAT